MSRFPLVLAALVLALAGCGGGDEPARVSSGGAGSSAFPVTIPQKVGGSVTIESEPKRVVTLDFPSTDAALALGVTPVGMYDVSYVPGGVQEWTKAKLGSATPERVNTDNGFPFEKLAALRPDVIIATNTYPLVAPEYEKLSAIAPVVTHVEAPGLDSWQQGVLQTGKALGREAQARKVIGDTEAEVRETAKAHPEFSGQTIAFFNYLPGDKVYAVSGDDDFSIKFLKQLGFEGVSPRLSELNGLDGRADVSPERYGVLDAGIVLGTSTEGESLSALDDDRLFNAVPAVRDGRYVTFGIGPATAIAFPSALSVPYAIDDLVPELSEAMR